MKKFRYLAIYIGWVVMMSYVAAGDAPLKYKPLDWEWTAAEKKQLLKDTKKVEKNSDGTYSLETDNWRIQTSHTPLFTVQAGKYMELFSEIFFKAFLLKGERGFTDFKPLLYVYDSREKYLKESGAPEWSGGLCRSGWQFNGDKAIPNITLFTYYQPADGEKEPVFGSKIPLGTIQHEGAHCLLQCVYGAMPIPLWLNEGVASYYEAWPLRAKISESGETAKDKEARVKRHFYSPAPNVLQRIYGEGNVRELPRLDELATANKHEEFYADNGGEKTRMNYMLAESFIEFLMLTKKRRPFMLSVLERVREQKGSSAEQPFVTAQEMLDNEKEWLMFLESHWGSKFNKDKIKIRVAELQKRVKESK